FSEFHYFLSTRDKRVSTDEIAEAAIRRALESHNLPYEVDESGGAFYGPKLDINLSDAIGRKWQLGTVQVDFMMPERFDLKYRASDGSDQRPVMIHRALAGSMERLFGVLIEHFAGNFPVWLAPVQAVVAAISEHQVDYAHSVRERLQKQGFRIHVDDTAERLSYKIRHWKMQKVPYILVVGNKEAEQGTVSVNARGVEQKSNAVTIENFTNEVHTKVVDKT
ncbi:MAG: His/Gly/Thr/Pro-type tRNA ligase C-terminal domain-containing protein, partial [Candidatus Eremiobacteraeota bacterium]|nr:His/Gly/Thr/Pro-type tRNA ligase C-terminal domain-containing protein [Candidatus Eremiobacteraeota bacterium]